MNDRANQAVVPGAGRAWLLVASPAVVALLWGLGVLPAWGAAGLGGLTCVLALVVLVRLRRAARADLSADGARVLVVGGGYAGLVAARALQARLPGGTRGGRHHGRPGAGIAGITVVDPQAHMTYQPFLPEAAAGAIEPRHITVPLRRALRRCDVVTGAVAAIDDAQRRAVVTLADGGVRELTYDVLVVAPGTNPRELPVPGLPERALGFRSVTDALALRDHVLARLDAAASTADRTARRRLLTFTVIGGGFAGLEALGELEDMARRAARHQPGYVADELRWVLLEASARIMPEVGAPLAARVHAQLVRRGVDVRVGAKLLSAEGGRVVLGGGHAFETDTIVVAAGSVPNPLLERTDLPLDARGRISCTTTLQVRDRPHVFTAGDCAAVPDVTGSGGGQVATAAPTAQHAVRQARLLAGNVDAFLGGGLVRGYRHRQLGTVAGLGRRRGVAEIGPIRLTGRLAWVLHRSYHLWAMPTADRTIRIGLDWLVTTFLGRDLVALGRRDPRPTGLIADPVEAAAEQEAPAPVWGADPSATPAGGAVDGPTMREPHPSFPPLREPHPSFPAFPSGSVPREGRAPSTGENPAMAWLEGGRHGRG